MNASANNKGGKTLKPYIVGGLVSTSMDYDDDDEDKKKKKKGMKY